MAVKEIIQSNVLLMTIIGILGGSLQLLCKLRKDDVAATAAPETSSRKLVKVLLITGAISDLFNLISLFMSTASGGWPLGSGSCEMFGFASTVLTACSSWIIALATIERYFVLILPSELSSTFSCRNIQITVTGIYIMMIMSATGPFYGFGDYTYLRGSLQVLVSSNITLPHVADVNQRHVKLETLHQLFSHIRRASYVDPRNDMLAAIGRYLRDNYHIIVSRASWKPHGILFFIRVFDRHSLELFMQHYRDKMIMNNVTNISFIDDVAMSLNISESELTANIAPEYYQQYTRHYMPLQELGLCTADMTSPNTHSTIWVGFYVTISFILPYIILLTILCLIYTRNHRHLVYSGKQISSQDVQHTNFICTFAIATCTLTLFYFAVVLSSADGIHISPDLVFWSSYFLSLKTVLFIIFYKLSNSSCNCYCKCCSAERLLRLCGFYAKGALSYELSEIDFSRSLTLDSASKGTKPLMTNL